MAKIEGVLHFDGSCNPNPGWSKCGFVLHVGTKIVERTVDLGRGTNNTAEYNALICGLQAALDEGVTHLEAYGDSMIVVRGMKKGPWSKGTPARGRYHAVISVDEPHASWFWCRGWKQLYPATAPKCCSRAVRRHLTQHLRKAVRSLPATRSLGSYELVLTHRGSTAIARRVF